VRPLRGQRAAEESQVIAADSHAEDPVGAGDARQEGERECRRWDRLQLPTRSIEALGNRKRTPPVPNGVTGLPCGATHGEELAGALRRIGDGEDRPVRAKTAFGHHRNRPPCRLRTPNGDTNRSIRTGHALEQSAFGAGGLRRGLQSPRVDAPEPALSQGQVDCAVE